MSTKLYTTQEDNKNLNILIDRIGTYIFDFDWQESRNRKMLLEAIKNTMVQKLQAEAERDYIGRTYVGVLERLMGVEK